MANHNSSNLCTIEDAIYVVKVCEAVIKSYNNKGMKIKLDKLGVK